MNDQEEKPKKTNRESLGAQEEKAQEAARHPRLIRAVVAQVKEELRFSGPIPPPDMLAAYGEAFAECPQRIVAMAEKELDHRHEMERTDLQGAITLRGRGQIIGFILALTGLLGGIYLLAHDKSVSGYAVLVGDVAIFGGTFIYDRFFKKEPTAQTEHESNPSPVPHSN